MTEQKDSPMPAEPRNELFWQLNVPMLNNRFFMSDFLKVVIISPLIMMFVVGIGFAVVGDISMNEALRFLGIMGLLGFGFLSILMGFVCLAFFWNKFPMDFTINQEFILAEAGKRIRKLDKFVIIMGALFGSGQVVGAGLLAQAQESVGIKWESIRLIEYYPIHRVVCVKNSWRTVLRLYCTVDNYETVEKFCKDQFEATANARKQDITESIAFKKELTLNIKEALTWISAALLSSLLLLACPLLEKSILIWVAFGACVFGSLASGEVRRFFGILSIVLTAGIAVGIIANGMVVSSDLFGLVRISGFEHATSENYLLEFIISMIGLIGLIVCALRNAMPKAKLIPVAALVLVGICVGGFLLGSVSNYKVSKLREQGPELQAVETNSWDSALLNDFKQKYNNRLRLYKLYITAEPAQKAGIKIQYQTALSQYQSALVRVRKTGTKIEIQEANLLDEVFEIWLRMK